jgi:hypothetical protein
MRLDDEEQIPDHVDQAPGEADPTADAPTESLADTEAELSSEEKALDYGQQESRNRQESE